MTICVAGIDRDGGVHWCIRTFGQAGGKRNTAVGRESASCLSKCYNLIELRWNQTARCFSDEKPIMIYALPHLLRLEVLDLFVEKTVEQAMRSRIAPSTASPIRHVILRPDNYEHDHRFEEELSAKIIAILDAFGWAVEILGLTPYLLEAEVFRYLSPICLRLSGLTRLTVSHLTDEYSGFVQLLTNLIKASRVGLSDLHVRAVSLFHFEFLPLLLSLSRICRG